MAGEALRVVNGAGAGTQIPLAREFLVGRSETGAGNLAGDSEISRRHARFQVTDYGQVILEDLGSTNGTFVNGARVAGPRVLAPGDQIRMGQTIVQFEAAVAAAPAAGVPPAPVAPPAAAMAPPPVFAAAPPLDPAAYGAGQPGGGAAPGPAGGPSSSRPAWLLPLGIGVAVLAVIGAIIAVASNSGSSSSTKIAPVATATAPAQTTPAPAPSVRSVPALEASIKSVLNSASSSGPSVTTVTCPPNAPSAAGSTFPCAVSGGQGLTGTVTITLKDGQRKSYQFKASLRGNGFTRTVSGTAS